MSCNEYISLVLFAGDDIARLEKCLCSILDYSPYQGYEMIVVEATNDVVMDAYLRKLPNIRLVAYDDWCLVGEMWQRGAELASGINIVFMQDCVLASRDWLKKMERVLAEKERVGIVQPFLAGGQEEDHGNALYASSQCFMIRRQALELAGGFAGEYQVGEYGLFDLSARLLKAGWSIWRDAECRLSLSSLWGTEYTAEQVQHDVQLFSKRNGYTFVYSSSVRGDILQMFDYKQPGVKILDIGCACGATLMTIKNNNPSAQLYGLELSEEAAAVARNFAQVEAGDFEAMERADFEGSFDYVLMGDVLEHLFDTDKALSKVHKWLKPGGSLIVSVPNIANISILAQQLQGGWEYVEAGILDKTHVRFFTERTIQLYLQRNGYKIRLVARKTVKCDDMLEALCKELLQLHTVSVAEEDLMNFQIICRAEK